ncbi:hypothetical protein EMIT0P2_40273 [Pseudomonas sp. IT-P2]
MTIFPAHISYALQRFFPCESRRRLTSLPGNNWNNDNADFEAGSFLFYSRRSAAGCHLSILME